MSAHKTILQKLKEKADAVKNDPTGAVGADVQDKATAAILSGIASPEWKAYMQMFADTPDQLKRLALEDSAKGDPYIRRDVVYIVANGMCGAGTTARMHENVDAVIDDGLPLG